MTRIAPIYRPLAIRAAHSHVPILCVILGVKIVYKYKHAQKTVDTENYAHCSEVHSVLCKKSPCITRNAKSHVQVFTHREQLLSNDLPPF